MGYYIICPFYISEKKQTISCEDSLHVFFDQEKKAWMKAYCRRCWRLCKFAKTLNDIYEEEGMSDWIKKARIEEQKAKAARLELKNLNREYGKRVAELDAAIQAKEAARKAAEHIIRVKAEQVKSLQDENMGWKQLHVLDQATIACLMKDSGISEFDGGRIRPFRERYDFSFTGKEESSMVRQLHIKEK